MLENRPFSIVKSEKYDLSHGFLPSSDPIQALPEVFRPWDDIVHALPKLFLTSQLQDAILSLPAFIVEDLTSLHDYERAMLMLSYLAHAYVWHNTQTAKPSEKLPAILAKPWDTIAKKIGRPPILSYASYALYNWYRIDPKKPVELGNIALLQNFLGGEDEEWFILIHVDIEAKAIIGLNALLPAIKAAKEQDITALINALEKIGHSLEQMCSVLDRMPEHCDPYIYFNRVRPYIHGWKNNPALQNGLIYEGVSETPRFYKGETGAQSSIIPCFDALLGVKHADNPLKQHLDEMQDYMPPDHRELLTFLMQHSLVRDAVQQHKDNETLREIYNLCIMHIARFRKTHVGYAAQYIQKQSQVTLANPTQVGTGGTPFMHYLRTHLDETEMHLI